LVPPRSPTPPGQTAPVTSVVAPPAPSELRYECLLVDGEEIHLVSHALDHAAAVDPLATLPRALADVARLALTGHETQSIARARGTSPRTVEKQLETLYRRLGVSSRTELITRFAAAWLPR
jgi:DNA-binding NarL/FixJ family response regulator